MTSYAIAVTLVNEDDERIFSEWVEDLPEWLTTDDDAPDFGAIYREAQSEYGRCTSSIYVDTTTGPPKRVGWFFVSRQQYEDTNEPYLRGAWVSVVERTPETRRLVEVAAR